MSIKNGYYYPDKFLESMSHFDYANQKIVEGAGIGACFGNRTAGKTVGFAIAMIDKYLRFKERCLLFTRVKDDVESGYLEDWWRGKIFKVDDEEHIIQNFVKNHDIKFSKTEMLVDGDVMCYCTPISMSHKAKDRLSTDNCRWLIMDEACQVGETDLIINSRPAMQRIFEIWQTVARGYRDAVKLTNIIFIANVDKITNWVFLDLQANKFVRPDTKFTVQNDIVVEMVNNENVAKEVASSPMGRIMQNSISGAEYYEAAQCNKYQDNRSFVKSKGLNFENLKIVLCCGVDFLGVFNESTNENEQMYHVAKIRATDKAPTICNNVKYHTETISYEDNGAWENALMLLYSSGKVTFNNQESKMLFFRYCGLEC